MPVSRNKKQPVVAAQTSFDLWGAANDNTSVVTPVQQSKPKSIQEVKLAFEPSRYQRAIFDFILANTGKDGIVQAAPGSGKTTTLREAVKLLPSDLSVLLIAFNKHIATELEQKLREAGVLYRSNSVTGRRSVNVSTVHSLGYATLANRLCGHNSSGRKLNLEENKYEKLVKFLCDERGLNRIDYVEPVANLIRVTQLTLTDPQDESAMREMVEHYDLGEEIVFWETSLMLARKALEIGKQLAEDKLIISYDDMVYLPNAWNLQPERYDWVFCDEWQDLSKSQLDLVLRCKRPETGRFLFVGDEHQSIFGFSCADTDGKARILERTNALELPLSISYRCPASHVALAATIYPEIEAAPDAKQGVLSYDMTERDLVKMVQPGDLVICRVTAPLVSACFKLIRSGAKAKMRGRDIGKSLRAIVKALEAQLEARGFNLKTYNLADADLPTWFEMYREKQFQQALRRGATELKLEGIRDKIETVRAIYENASPQPRTTADLKDLISDLFADSGNCVWFSSVHRAKGSEAKNVWLLRDDLMPHPMAKLAWEIEQEHNIRYVAYTRAKEALYVVH